MNETSDRGIQPAAVPAPKTKKRRRRRGGCMTWLIALLAIVAVVVAVSVWWWSTYLVPDQDIESGQPVQIEIAEGADSMEIATTLSGVGVVPNANMLRLHAWRAGLDGELKAGVYDLHTGMDYVAVLDILAAGPPIRYVTVTIPEGFTVEQMAERFEEEIDVPAAGFLELATEGTERFDYEFLSSNPEASLEGYLFPKTYRIQEGSTAEDVVRLMLEQFEREIQGIDLAHIAAQDLTLHDWVTIASMIEREVRVPEERPLVSSVIFNRLSAGMLLEIDATIEYILPGTRPRLLNRHLAIDSPYNTYMYKGLPPTPIAAPGLEALKAAAAPAETGFVYYVLTGEDGSHTFTETYAEFLQAKEKSREVVP